MSDSPDGHPQSPLVAVVASLRSSVVNALPVFVISDQFRTALLSFLAGGAAGSLGKTIVAPIDRVKILFQISRMPYSARAVYGELSRTFVQEGFQALFRGNWAQVVRVYPYSGIQLMSFDQYSQIAMSFRQRSGQGDASPGPPARLTGTERLFAGAAAGVTSVLITYPLDVVRARLAVQVTRVQAGVG